MRTDRYHVSKDTGKARSAYSHVVSQVTPMKCGIEKGVSDASQAAGGISQTDRYMNGAVSQ